MPSGHVSDKVNHPVLLLFGREVFLKKEALTQLCQQYFPKGHSQDPNYQEFNAETASFVKVLEFLQTAPFLGERRVAVLQLIEELSEEDKGRVCLYAEKPLPWGVLVLITEQNTLKKNAFLGRLSLITKTIACYTPFEKDLPAWIHHRAKKVGLGLDNAAVRLLIERKGTDLGNLSMAIEQLYTYMHPRKAVEAEAIEKIFPKRTEEDLYQFVDHVIEKKTVKSIEMLAYLFRGGVKSYEIIGAFVSQLHKIRKAGALQAQGLTNQEIAAQLRIHLFFLDRLMRQVSIVPQGRIQHLLQGLDECDRLIKTGQLEEAKALQQFIIFEKTGLCA